MPKSAETIAARDNAITYAMDRFNTTAIQAFGHIDRNEFLSDLVVRIKKPKSIDQADLGFCGPAAVLYALAKDDPISYATLACDLFLTGKASVRGWTVEAGSLAGEKLPEGSQIGCCDWVTMACVRKNVGFGALVPVPLLAKGAYPWEIKDSLQKLGYMDVRNETYSSAAGKAIDDMRHKDSVLNNFVEAVSLMKKGYRVVLCVNDSMFNNPGASALLPNHFCTLKGFKPVAEQNGIKIVDIRVWQWGKVSKEPATAGSSVFVKLPMDQFMTHYFGYIAGGDSTVMSNRA